MQILGSPQIQIIISVLEIIFIIFSLLMLLGIIFLTFKTSWLRYRYLEDYTEFFASRPFGTKARYKRMESIQKKLNSGKESDYKMAVIEADDFLKEVLERMGYKGEFLEDILLQVNDKILPSLEKIKDVRKIRNNIVHDPDYNLTKDQALNITRTYEQALRELEAL